MWDSFSFDDIVAFARDEENMLLFTSILIAVPLTLVLLTALTMGLFGKNQFVIDGRTVVITGASQGLGRSLARECAKRGANVVLVARNLDKLNEAMEYAKAGAKYSDKQRFHVISADLTSPSENARLLEETTKWNDGNPPDVVWANAGSAHPYLYADTSIETLRSQMDIDYWAAAYLAHETINLWKKPMPASDSKNNAKGEELPRHLIITSSLIAFVGLAGYAPYAPAKAALRSLSDSLRSELQLYNGARKHATEPLNIPPIKNHIVFPGGIISPGLDAENEIKHPVTKMLEKDDVPEKPDDIASASLKALEKGHYMITTVMLGHLMRTATLAGSPRNGLLGIRDTMLGFVSYLAWLIIGPDLESKVIAFGKKNGAK